MTKQIRYSYGPVPTICDFAASNAFIRALVGPFGSGKSSGSIVEIVRRAQAQRPGPDGVRRSRWAVVRNCFDDQTEILTEQRGWQLFRNLMPDDKVAQLRDGNLEFVLPTMHYAAPYCGEMIGFEGEGIDMLVTPDHRMWVSERHTRQKIWADYGLRKASDIYGRQTFRVKRDAVWIGAATKHTEDFFEWLGFWFAEGCAGQYFERHIRRRQCTTTQHKPEGIVYVEDLHRRSGLAYTVTDRPGGKTFRIRNAGNEALIDDLAGCGKALNKFMRPWMKAAPPGHLAAFIRGFVAGDGWKSGGSTFACTSSPQLADDLQEIALKAGLVANITVDPIVHREGSFKANAPRNVVTFVTPKKYAPVLRGESDDKSQYLGWYKKPYDGMVYCLEVPTHVVYVRRHGRAHWSSQTYSELRDTTMRTVFQWLPIEHFGKFYVSDHRYVVKAFEKCEFEIMFRALDKPDDIGKLLSLELTGGWINEAREVPWAVVDALQARVDRYPAKMDGGCSWAGIWMDTNPPDADSKFYKFFEERTWLPGFEEMRRAGTLPKGVEKPEDYAAIFKQPGGRSPEAENVPNLSSGYYDRLALGKSPEWVKVYVDGQYGFVMDGKPVFPEYNDRAHCQKVEPIEGPVVYRGFDFGLTPSCVFAQILPDGRFLVFDEMVADNMGIDRFSDQVLNHCARSFPPKVRFEDYGDPAGEQRAQTDEKTVFQILQNKGINIEAGEQSPSLRLESVRKPLNTMIAGEPQFVLNPRCKTLRKGFQGGYHYRRMNVRGERFVDEPDKNEFSHPHDALQYICTRVFGTALTARQAYDDFGATQIDYGSDVGRSGVTGY